MHNRTLKLTVLTLVLAVAAGSAWAADEPAKDKPQRPDRQAMAGEFMAKRLNLTDDQAKQVQQIMAEHHQKMQELRKQMMDQMDAVLDDQQMEQFKQMGPMGGPRGEGRGPGDRPEGIREGGHKGEGRDGKGRPEGGADQARGEGKGRGEGRGMAMLEKLNLSEEQAAKARQIMQDARQQAQQTEDPQQKRQLMRGAWEKISAQVLNDEQRTKLQQMHEEREKARKDARLAAPEAAPQAPAAPAE